VDINALKAQFNTLFPGGTGPLIVVQAPGRVNLIGEHTDYNEGFVCPMAIDRNTTIVCRPRPDGLVRMHSNTAHETVEFPIDRAVPKEGPAWALYAKGVAEALRQKNLVPHGIDALVDATVPLGGGLSSSASFEMATGMALLTANKTTLDPVSLALAGQWAEHNYPGVPCGIMDQFISVMGQAGHALLLDCRDRSVRHVPLADPDLRVVIANTNVKHALVGGEYAARQNQCKEAVKIVQGKYPQVKSLRNVTMKMLDEMRPQMADVVYRRARHVITEEARTTGFAAALEARDYATCGQLMYGSHAALRDDYEVSCVELDALVEIARKVPGVYGARMTGGGFGGCIVALTTAAAVEPLTAALLRDYKKAYNKDATIFATVPSAGAHVVA